MRLISNESLKSNSFIKLKDNAYLERQRKAGKVVANALTLLANEVNNKTKLSLLELNQLAEDYITGQGCELTFKNYKGFPAGVCISVNNFLVHGIPTDYNLQEGDKVSFDLGATFEGAIADSALTCIYGEPKNKEIVRMNLACEEALMKGIAAAKVGNRLGAIGHAVYKSAKGNGFNVIEQYGGHGICNHEDGSGMPHAQPFVPNKSNFDEGIRLQAGMTLAIEPMLFPYGFTSETKISKDGWSVYMNCIGLHWEHTIFIHEDHTEIITSREGL